MSIFKNKSKVELGQKVKDSVTGLVGMCVARTEWLHGCARITIQPPVDKDGKVPDNYTIDELQVVVVDEQRTDSKRTTGGPTPAPRQKNGPTIFGR